MKPVGVTAYTPRLVQRVPLDFRWPLCTWFTDSRLPTGNGWQLWETFPEFGCPISPVFLTAEALAMWCSSHVTMHYDRTIPGMSARLGYMETVCGPWSPMQWLKLIHSVSSYSGPANVTVGISAFRDDWILLFPFN